MARWPGGPKASRKICLPFRSGARAQGVGFLIAEPRRPSAARSGLWDALVLGVRDYLGKNGFPGAILGLSGGIDSALVLAIAVDALGADKVRAVMMPSPYTADISWIDAREMAERVKVRYDEISIVPEFEAFKASLAGEFKGLKEDTTEENIQARIRGVFLMALSNKFGSIVLTTGNKSEMATGYCTLYGDMAGGFAVIKDVLKTSVFALARWRNANDPYGTGSNPIPERIITRRPAPSCAPTRPTRTACRPTRCWTPSWRATWKTTKAPTASSPPALTARWSNAWRG
jgi:NAD+ synthase (glutamine-hydrolysing)